MTPQGDAMGGIPEAKAFLVAVTKGTPTRTKAASAALKVTDFPTSLATSTLLTAQYRPLRALRWQRAGRGGLTLVVA
jgi:hypothetical protein